MTDSANKLHLEPISPAASGPLYQPIVASIKREVLANRLTALIKSANSRNSLWPHASAA